MEYIGYPVGDDIGGAVTCSPGGSDLAPGSSRAGQRDGGAAGGADAWCGQGGRPPRPAADGRDAGRGGCNAVTGYDVPDRNLPDFLRLSRGDVPAIGDASLAALLAGAELPAGPAPELRSLADALAGLKGQPASDELEGEAGTLAAFRNQFGLAAARPPWAGKLSAWLRSLPVKAVAAVAATVLSLGGIAAAAYAGALPAGLQRIAHDIIGASGPGSRPATRPFGPGPAATGHRADGLCAAWAHAKADGTRKQQAVAFGKLAAAAGGPGHVTAYCATITPLRTSPSPRPHPAPTPHASRKPSGLPTPHGAGKPSGLPTPHGSGKPTGLPAPHGSGKPTGLPTPHGSGGPTVHLQASRPRTPDRSETRSIRFSSARAVGHSPRSPA